MQEIENVRDVGVNHERAGINLSRSSDLRHGFRQTSHRSEMICVPMMGVGVVWIKFNRAPEFRLRLRPVPVKRAQVIGERRMRFRQRVVKRDCFARQVFS